MAALRDMYAAANYSTAFLQATLQTTVAGTTAPQTDEDRENRNVITSTQGLAGNGLRVHLPSSGPESDQLASPPADLDMDLTAQKNHGSVPALDGLVSDDNTDRRRNSSLVSACPSSDRRFTHSQHVNHMSPYSQNWVFDNVDAANDRSPMYPTLFNYATMTDHVNNFELDSHSTTNLGAAGMRPNIEEGDFGVLQGESDAFTLDPDWMMGIGADGLLLIGEESGSAIF